jgi:hypothetical protein
MIWVGGGHHHPRPGRIRLGRSGMPFMTGQRRSDTPFPQSPGGGMGRHGGASGAFGLLLGAALIPFVQVARAAMEAAARARHPCCARRLRRHAPVKVTADPWRAPLDRLGTYRARCSSHRNGRRPDDHDGIDPCWRARRAAAPCSPSTPPATGSTEKKPGRWRGGRAAHGGRFATNHAAAVFWAIPLELWLATQPLAPRTCCCATRPPSPPAAVVDYGLVPKRLTPAGRTRSLPARSRQVSRPWRSASSPARCLRSKCEAEVRAAAAVRTCLSRCGRACPQMT